MKHRGGQLSLREEAKKSEGQFLHEQSLKAIFIAVDFYVLMLMVMGRLS